MKSLLKDLLAFHCWANEQLGELFLQMEPASWQVAVKSSFPSLGHTVWHLRNAEAIWWMRIKGHSPASLLGDPFTESREELISAWWKQGRDWNDWFENFPEQDLEKKFSYLNFKGVRYESSYNHLILHLVNHGTYHRGQLVTILHQIGCEKIPPTDFIVWSRFNVS